MRVLTPREQLVRVLLVGPGLVAVGLVTALASPFDRIFGWFILAIGLVWAVGAFVIITVRSRMDETGPDDRAAWRADMLKNEDGGGDEDLDEDEPLPLK